MGPQGSTAASYAEQLWALQQGGTTSEVPCGPKLADKAGYLVLLGEGERLNPAGAGHSVGVTPLNPESALRSAVMARRQTLALRFTQVAGGMHAAGSA